MTHDSQASSVSGISSSSACGTLGTAVGALGTVGAAGATGAFALSSNPKQFSINGLTPDPRVTRVFVLGGGGGGGGDGFFPANSDSRCHSS